MTRTVFDPFLSSTGLSASGLSAFWLGILVWKWLAATAVIAGRFLLFGLLPAVVLRRSGNRGLNRAVVSDSQMRREFTLGVFAVFIQIASFYQLRLLVNLGVSRLYVEPLRYGALYLVLQIPLFLVFVDGVFYALHRWMHTPFMLRNFHAVHHRSRDIDPLTNFSTHPLEAFLQVSIAVVATIVFPVNETVITGIGLVLIAQNFYLHSAREIFAAPWIDRPVARVLTTSTYHHLHHTSPNSNFGVYLRIWDRLFRTENPAYVERFREVARK